MSNIFEILDQREVEFRKSHKDATRKEIVEYMTRSIVYDLEKSGRCVPNIDFLQSIPFRAIEEFVKNAFMTDSIWLSKK